MSPKPCEHYCELGDLTYLKRKGVLRRIVCKVCGRTWDLQEAVPSKHWPRRWVLNCPPPHAKTHAWCRVIHCTKHPDKKGHI